MESDGHTAAERFLRYMKAAFGPKKRPARKAAAQALGVSEYTIRCWELGVVPAPERAILRLMVLADPRLQRVIENWLDSNELGRHMIMSVCEAVSRNDGKAAEGLLLENGAGFVRLSGCVIGEPANEYPGEIIELPKAP